MSSLWRQWQPHPWEPWPLMLSRSEHQHLGVPAGHWVCKRCPGGVHGPRGYDLVMLCAVWMMLGTETRGLWGPLVVHPRPQGMYVQGTFVHTEMQDRQRDSQRGRKRGIHGFTCDHSPASPPQGGGEETFHTQRDTGLPRRETTNREGRICRLHRAWGLGQTWVVKFGPCPDSCHLLVSS